MLTSATLIMQLIRQQWTTTPISAIQIIQQAKENKAKWQPNFLSFILLGIGVGFQLQVAG